MFLRITFREVGSIENWCVKMPIKPLIPWTKQFCTMRLTLQVLEDERMGWVVFGVRFRETCLESWQLLTKLFQLLPDMVPWDCSTRSPTSEAAVTPKFASELYPDTCPTSECRRTSTSRTTTRCPSRCSLKWDSKICFRQLGCSRRRWKILSLKLKTFFSNLWIRKLQNNNLTKISKRSCTT